MQNDNQDQWLGELGRELKKKAWNRFRLSYRNKFKKDYDEKIFVILSSLSLVQKSQKTIETITIGFGTKSLPKSSINQTNKNDLIKDMHAQIMAIQGFKRFILKQIQTNNSTYIRWDQHKQKYQLKDQYQLVLYCSEVFCGDCCINEELLSYSGAKPLKFVQTEVYPEGKYEYGILRTKPGRSDLPISKRSHILSCSDLIAAFNVLGIQGKKLFSLIKPIYISKIYIQAPASYKQNIVKGINFPKRLHLITHKKQTLINRQILNIIIKGKQRTISSQFKLNVPDVFVIDKIDHNRNREGFQLTGIITQNQEQWINGKTGLPQGSSLKNYITKGKISIFSQNKLLISFPNYLNNNKTFKYQAIENRLKYLFGEWIEID